MIEHDNSVAGVAHAATDPSRNALSVKFGNLPWAALVIALTAISVAVRLPSRFWLDETMSFWTASHGLHQIFIRCTAWPHPVLYSILILGLHRLGSSGEWIYRLPSFVAMGGCSYLLFRMTCRLFDSQVAWMSTAVFVSIDAVKFEAGDARPYALALLLSLIASDLLIRLLSRPSYTLAILYGVSAAGILYFQILYGAVLAVHCIYYAWMIARGKRIRLKYAITGSAVLLALAAPVVIQFLGFAGHAVSHSFAPPPALPNLGMAYVPTCLLYVFEMVAMLALFSRKVQWRIVRESEVARLFYLLWLMPPVMFFAVSVSSAAHLFVPRYYLFYSPGLAVCFGIILSAFQPRIIQTAALILLSIFAAYSVVRPSPLRHTDGMGDWGATAAYVSRNVAQDHAPVLIRSQFVESDFVPILPIDDNGAFAQLSFYPIKALLVPLRNTFTKAEGERIHRFLQALPPGPSRFLLVSTAGPAPLESYLQGISGELGASGTLHQLADLDGVAIIEYRLQKPAK